MDFMNKQKALQQEFEGSQAFKDFQSQMQGFDKQRQEFQQQPQQMYGPSPYVQNMMSGPPSQMYMRSPMQMYGPPGGMGGMGGLGGLAGLFGQFRGIK